MQEILFISFEKKKWKSRS